MPYEPEFVAIDPSPTPREVVNTVAWAMVLVVLALAPALSLILFVSLNTPPLKP